MLQSVTIERDLFFARPRESNDGYTRTLATWLGSMLRLAEECFGPRDASYTLLGIEFGEDVPQIWYPKNCRQIVIQITPSCATDTVRACYQLAHECIHLLAPSGGRNSNILEEGLATHFARRFLIDTFGLDWPSTVASYAAARSAVEELLATDDTVIRRLRERQPALYLMAASDILAVAPETRPNLAAFLCHRFTRG